MNAVQYTIERTLDVEEFRDVLVRSTLSERRPVQHEERLKKMCSNADLIITARLDGKLIGVSRSLTDFSFCTYLSDLAVDQQYQGKGIGKELILKTKEASGPALLILLAAPGKASYYNHIGMEQFGDCFLLKEAKFNPQEQRLKERLN